MFFKVFQCKIIVDVTLEYSTILTCHSLHTSTKSEKMDVRKGK